MKFSKQLGIFLILIGVATSLIIVGELSGEFGKIRQLSSKPQRVLSITRGEFISLNNSVLFGFDVDGEGKDVLRVKWLRTKLLVGTSQSKMGKEFLEARASCWTQHYAHLKSMSL
ncbi:MAG: hypothetical protein NWE91_01020 [Candidatus Bathyarchaeota archaeon]|nr:hypothetical protein [Candidatus Bathyarchaeota archaeon]